MSQSATPFAATTPEAVRAAQVARNDKRHALVRGRGVEWVRPTDLMVRHSATAAGRGIDDWRGLPVDAELVRFAETQLSGAIGSASARVMVASVAKEEDLGLDEVLDILDEATQVRAYSRELEVKQQANALLLYKDKFDMWVLFFNCF